MAVNWPWSRRTGKGSVVPERKSGGATGFVAIHAQGEARWTRRDYATLAREGFMRNPIVHRSVRLIAETAATIPWLLYEGVAELDDHPLLRLLERPNERQAGASFLEALYGHLLLSGNAYVELVEASGGARELHLLRPDRVAVATDASGWPTALEYREGSQRRRIALGTGRRRRGGASEAVPSARRPLRLCAAGGGPDGARHAQCRRALEQGAARQFGAALGRAGLCAEGGRQSDATSSSTG